MRNEKTCVYYNEPSSKSAWHAHMAEELEKELATSIIASSRIGRSTPRFSVEPARTWSPPPCSFVTCPSHRTPTPVKPEMKSKDSLRPLPCSRPRVLPQANVGLPQSSLPSPPDRRGRPRFIPITPNGTG
jgi:hypothetical protein